MLYQRGTNRTYQAWANAVGDQSWTFDSLLSFFEKSVNYTAPSDETRAADASASPSLDAYSSSSGPLYVSHPNTAALFPSWGQLGFRAMGIPNIEDFSSGKLIGSQYCLLTICPNDQSRSSCESSFLKALFACKELLPTLSIYIHTLGSKILFDDNKPSTGILVKSAGMTYLLNATK